MDGESRWAHDDWLPAEHEPIEFDRPRRAGERVGPTDGGDGGRSGRRLAAVAIVAVVGIAGFLLARDPGDRNVVADPVPDSFERLDTLAPTTTRRPVLGPPTSQRPSTVAPSTTQWPFAHLAPVEPGEMPEWHEWAIDVPTELAGLPPTELLVVAADGVLHRLRLPSGAVRSVVVQRSWSQHTLVALPDAVAIASDGRLLIVPDDAPAVTVQGLGSITDITPIVDRSAIAVTGWPETGPGH